MSPNAFATKSSVRTTKSSHMYSNKACLDRHPLIEEDEPPFTKPVEFDQDSRERSNVSAVISVCIVHHFYPDFQKPSNYIS